MANEKKLLLNWWWFCGRTEHTIKEDQEFEDLIETYGYDKILEVAVVLYASNDSTPEVLLKKIQKNTASEWIQQLPGIDETLKSDYEAVKACFEAEISERSRKTLAAFI